MQAYDVVSEFEKRVAEYAGAPYGVAVNSCSNALFLSCVYKMNFTHLISRTVYIPRYTYVGVPYAIIGAGYVVEFTDEKWKGIYTLAPLNIIDSARRFRRGMFAEAHKKTKDCLLYCVSFHETKILPIGDGGMILTDNKEAYDALRQMRFDGRTPGKSVFEDDFYLPAYHCHMKPDVATRGLMLMAGVKDYNEDLPETYPDLSKYPIFQRGYTW